MTTIDYTSYDSRIAAIHKARVNRASLQAESRIIRREEQRAGAAYRTELRFHRTGQLRYEARIAALAYGYLRGRKYLQMERKTKEKPKASEIVAKLSRWDYRADAVAVSAWLG